MFPSQTSGVHHFGWDFLYTDVFFFCIPQLCLWGSPFWVRFFAYVTVFNPNQWGSHIPSSWMVHARCVFCCWHSPVWDMNVRIFWGCTMDRKCAQIRPRFILSCEKSLGGMESEAMLTPREKSPLPEKFSPEEDQTHDTASSRTASPTHCQPAIPAPVADWTVSWHWAKQSYNIRHLIQQGSH